MSQVNDIKVRLIVTMYEDGAVLDVSTATAKQIIIKKPTGTILTKTASFLTDGIDGKIYWDTISSDLDEAGTYRVQGYIEINGGSYKGSVAVFKVYCNLE